MDDAQAKVHANLQQDFDLQFGFCVKNYPKLQVELSTFDMVDPGI